jgi:hypothetical protein
MIKRQFKYVSGSTGQTYNVSVLLTSTLKDFGFFDTYEHDGVTNKPITGDTYTVSGTCTSRLNELRKYTTNSNLAIRYVQSTGTIQSYPAGLITLDSDLITLDNAFITLDNDVEEYITDGLDLAASVISGVSATTLVYYIGGIKYVDRQLTGSTAVTTTFILENLQFSYVNFDYKPIIKLESKQNMIENPRINSDVFIERQQLSVFEDNYRLRGINSLSDLINYAGGNYFTIYNNS